MKKTDNKEVSRFPFKFSRTILILCIAALALSVLGIVISVIRIVKYGISGFNDIIKYPFMIVICVLAIVLLISLLCRSEYAISEKYLHSNFGLIKSKIELKNITSVVADLQEEKVSVYMGEEFIVLILKKDTAQAFSSAILKANPKIEFSYTLTENKPSEEDKKE